MARTRTAPNTYRNMQTNTSHKRGILTRNNRDNGFPAIFYSIGIEYIHRWLEGTAKTGLPHCNVAQLLNQCFLGLVAAATLWVVIVRRIG